MIHIEKGSLCSLKQYVSSSFDIFIEHECRVCTIFPEHLRIAVILVENFFKGKRFFLQEFFEKKVLLLKTFFQSTCKELPIEKIHKPDTASADLVLIGRADAT